MTDPKYPHPFETITVTAPDDPDDLAEWSATVVVETPAIASNIAEFEGWFERHGNALIAVPGQLPGGFDEALTNRLVFEVGRELADETGFPLRASIGPETRELAHDDLASR